MTLSIHESYKNNSEFWRKNKPKLQGDIEQRPYAVEMLGEVSGKTILEAGCGSGYVARMIARKGAKVFGVDNSNNMLVVAKAYEIDDKLGIKYESGDITKYIPYDRESFDGIACVGVVHHLNADEYDLFLEQANRVLKKDSPLVISLVHPSLFYPGSPARNNEKCCTKFYPMDNKPMDFSQRFHEELYDIDEQCFRSTLWYHPESVLFNYLTDSGFRIEQVNECIFRKEHRLTPAWGEEYNYPTHLQIKAIKGGRE